ncbi:unnamed protein product [Onchocerca ochengi]|uniref:Fidgetin-like 1 n=1 Tax=Onchocerca ochengi TaxID=42157 RepID=A0A182ENA6_ONCOC|nr:unnamed protein product [Onchocerca ochengi]
MINDLRPLTRKAKLSGQQDQCMNKSPAEAAAILEYYYQCNKASGGSVSTSVDTINSSATRKLPSATDSSTSVANVPGQYQADSTKHKQPFKGPLLEGFNHVPSRFGNQFSNKGRKERIGMV